MTSIQTFATFNISIILTPYIRNNKALSDNSHFSERRNPLVSLKFYLILLTALGLFSLAYQVEQPLTLKFGDYSIERFLENFNSMEYSPQIGNFRWSRPVVKIHLAGWGSAPQMLHFKFAGGPLPKPRQGRVIVNGHLVGEFTAQPDPAINELDFRVDRAALLPSGDLDIEFQIERLDLPKDARSLGTVILELDVTPLVNERKFVFPALLPLVLLVGSSAFLYLIAWTVGLRGYWLPLPALLFAMLMAFALVTFRLEAVEGSGAICGALGLGLFSLVSLRPLLLKLFHAGEVFPSTKELDTLLVLYLSVFTILCAGFLDPAFSVVDHMFRVHQVLSFLNDPLTFLKHYYNVTTAGPGGQNNSAFIGQWGMAVRFPYPPFFYILVSPLGLLFQSDKALLGVLLILVAFLSASTLFPVYYLARRFWKSGWAALVAAGLSGVMPVNLLPLSDGEFLHIAGQWFSLVAIAFLLANLEKSVSWQKLGIGVTLFTLTFLIFVASFALAATTLLFLTLYFWVVSKQPVEPGVYLEKQKLMQGFAKRVVLWSGGGVLGAFLIYYLYYLGPLLVATLPVMLGKVTQGQGIGQNSSYLLHFWPQAMAHYKGLPLLLAIFSSGWLGWRKATRLNPLTGLLIAAFLTLIVFSGIDHFIYLFQKHMIFIGPFVGLSLAGGVLALFEQHQKEVKGARLKYLLINASISLIFVVLSVSWLIGWWERVFYYNLPSGSG